MPAPSNQLYENAKTNIQKQIAQHPNLSGFHVLASGGESFLMRLALMESAKETLDLQYYSIHDDTTANLLLEALVRAAKRGVNIRFLLDSININEVDKTFSALNDFKNLEVRIFNPLTMPHDTILSRVTRMFTDVEILNHRMHNKALISDREMAIIGGRNLGDEYFEEHSDITFRDIDILGVGPIAEHIFHSFDTFWNSKDSIPIHELMDAHVSLTAMEKTREELAANWQKVFDTPKGRKLLDSDFTEKFKNGNIDLTWAVAELVADGPGKVENIKNMPSSKPLLRLDSLLEKATSEFVAVSPYFVPREDGIQWLSSLVSRGIKVRILTNSLGSTDVVAVHTGYRRYREELITNGIELYEMKPINGKRPRQRLIGKKAPAYASLHAKVYIIDQREVMIGSFNLDPRSIELNTELTLVIHSQEVAAKLLTMFDEVTSPNNSYRLSLQNTLNGNLHYPQLIWRTQEQNKNVEFHQEPYAGVWRSLEAGFMALFPIENQL